MPPTLESLPPEILFNIISYTSPFNHSSATPHNTLSALVKTSRPLNLFAQEYARSLLRQHANITVPHPQNTKYIGKYGANVKRWKRWVSTTCQTCKSKSKKKAILTPEIVMCKKCDKLIPKMTMSEAIQTHHLSKLDLFTPNQLHPSLPPLLFGCCRVLGTETTMISTPDVLAREKLIHDMLGSDYVMRTGALRRRVASHNRLATGLDITLRNGKWIKAGKFDRLDKNSEMKEIRILATPERREVYVREMLKRERAAMGQGEQGGSVIDLTALAAG